MLISLILVIISRCTHILKHHVVYLTYISFLFVNSASIKDTYWDFLGGPLVETLPSNARSAGSILGQGAKIPYAS